jgi:uncharacterized glyoxalase superfamily protein PhnB
VEAKITAAIPVLPAADVSQSLNWWTKICGFEETFRDATPPMYAGIKRDEAYVHLSAVDDRKLAREIGDQTMVRLAVKGIDAMYAGIKRDEAYVHLSGIDDTKLARQIGDQTMLRLAVKGVDAMYAEFQSAGGQVHPNAPLEAKPWGTREFTAIDPNGVCVTFVEQ